VVKLKTSRFENTIKKHEVKPNYAKNMGHAFLFGGLICLLGQGMLWLFENVFDLPNKEASTHMIVVMILLASILTGLGVYDKFGQIAKAGAFVPITGFANSLTASAMEGKSEGIVLGIANNMFKLAGTVIVVAVMSGFVFGIIRYILQQLGIVGELEHEVVQLLLGVLV
jgi:stage V sporulation protein AC